MSLYFIMAQIMGVLALIFLAYSFQNDNKKTLLKFQIISSFLYAMQYLFLGAFTGCVMNIVCMVRNYLFKEYGGIEISLKWLLIIISAMSLLTMFTYDGLISLLPFLAVFSFTISLWIGNLRLIRIVEAIAAVLYIVSMFMLLREFLHILLSYQQCYLLYIDLILRKVKKRDNI